MAIGLKSSNKRTRMARHGVLGLTGRTCPRSASVTACFEAFCDGCRRFNSRGHERMFTYSNGTNTNGSIKSDWALEAA